MQDRKNDFMAWNCQAQIDQLRGGAFRINPPVKYNAEPWGPDGGDGNIPFTLPLDQYPRGAPYRPRRS